MAYKVHLVQEITLPVQEYWLRIHRIYPLPAKLVQTQQYQLQQWYNQFKTKRWSSTFFQPEARTVPDNLTIKLNFEKELQSVQYKREKNEIQQLFICESNGYRADPV